MPLPRKLMLSEHKQAQSNLEPNLPIPFFMSISPYLITTSGRAKFMPLPRVLSLSECKKPKI